MNEHYRKIVITADMVGKKLDPAMIADLYELRPMQLQGLKKILCGGERGAKDYVKDQREAIGAFERDIELYEESEARQAKYDEWAEPFQEGSE